MAGAFCELDHRRVVMAHSCDASRPRHNASCTHIVASYGLSGSKSQKWIDGQGRVLGGVVVGRADLIRDIYLFCRNTGPAMSPFNAWVLSKSLETLDVRMERHSSNALFIAESLETHAKISSLRYPFLNSHPHVTIAKKQMKNGGGIVCFDLKGGL